MLHGNNLRSRASAFRKTMGKVKAGSPIGWYPYDSLHNIDLMPEYFPREVIDRLETGHLGWRILDVGAGDGDVGFFFESLGCDVDMLDNPSTNFNDCNGITTYASLTQSKSRLIVHDIDRAFHLEGQYDLAIALGLLYHLRNPMNLLLTLAMHAERLALSTRVFRFLPDGTNIEKYPVAYFLRRREANDDPTNYWILSPLALETLLTRSGWAIRRSILQGATASNPVANDADQRMFLYAERVPNWQDLGTHHDF
jgi:tRNA (mo5U34)-methyltransferase